MSTTDKDYLLLEEWFLFSSLEHLIKQLWHKNHEVNILHTIFLEISSPITVD